MTAQPAAAHRIPCLDGLRAISIVLVLILHVSGTKNFLPTSAVDIFAPGDLGVRVFFVISGYLITTLLLREIQKTGTISLKAFYFRRVLRIFPAFYTYAVVLLILSAAGWITLGAHDILIASTYTANYHYYGISWYIAHLWSLSVEEQFYLLWPAALFLTGRRNGMRLAAGVLVAVPLIRVALYYLAPDYRLLIFKSFETSCDAIAAGCLLAGVRHWLGDQSWYRRFFLESKFIYFVPFLIVGCSMLVERPRIHMLLAIPLENVLIAFLIDWLVRYPQSLAGRILETKPFVHIGVLSYSLYLWQQLYCGEWRFPNTWWGQFPVNIVLAFITAHASYYIVEKPFLALKTKIELRRREERERVAAA